MDEIFAFKPSQVIFEENDRSDGFYIIKTGSVQIYRTVPTDNGNEEVELARLESNEIFGEMGLIDLKGRSASARALSPTILNFISYETFARDIVQLPPWHTSFVMTLVRRLRTANHKITQSAIAERQQQRATAAAPIPAATKTVKAPKKKPAPAKKAAKAVAKAPTKSKAKIKVAKGKTVSAKKLKKVADKTAKAAKAAKSAKKSAKPTKKSPPAKAAVKASRHRPASSSKKARKGRR